MTNLPTAKKKEIAKDCIRQAVAQLEMADSLLFGQDPEMEIFPHLHTATAYAAIVLEKLKDDTEAVILTD